jgi:hypothetical protein
MEYKSQREEAEMDMKTIEEPPRESFLYYTFPKPSINVFYFKGT